MNHPPYHLRPNKAVDRFLLVEALRLLSRHIPLSQYTYYGLGGPFLEDCRLLHEYFPDLSLVSLETNKHTYNRQKFHRFSKSIELKLCNSQNFLPTLNCKGSEIIWLDYVDLKACRFNEFIQMLQKGEHGSIVKVTVRAQRDDNPHEFRDIGGSQLTEHLAVFRQKLEKEFYQVLPATIEDSELIPGNFPTLVQRMFQIAAEKALPAINGTVFQPLHSAHYMDGTRMFSLVGIVYDREEAGFINRKIGSWKFSNTRWQPPHHIDVPLLSAKERLHLEGLLPTTKNTGRALARALKYWIGDSEKDNLRRLQQYADFHKYYPFFGKVSV